jgi:Domain of unknown function DUF11
VKLLAIILATMTVATALAATVASARAGSGPDLVVTVAADPRSPKTGREVTYTIKVRNRGDRAASGVELFVGCDDNLQCGPAGAVPATLNAGASAKATMVAIANPCGLSFTRSARVRVEVSSTSVDPDLSNNSDQVTVKLQKCATTELAKARLDVRPKRVKFGTRPVGSLTFKGVTVTNTSRRSLLVLVDAIELPDDFNFGNLAGSTCIALEGQVLAPGESCVAIVGFQPSEFFAGQRQTATLLATASDPASGELLRSVTVKVLGKGRVVRRPPSG